MGAALAAFSVSPCPPATSAPVAAKADRRFAVTMVATMITMVATMIGIWQIMSAMAIEPLSALWGYLWGKPATKLMY